MLDVLILAVIAGFIFTKLFKTLGKVEDGDETRTNEIIKNFKKRQSGEDNAEAEINIASAFEASMSQKVRDTFDKARKIDPKFNAEKFLNGAKQAFEVIVKAYVGGDKPTLQQLLSRDVFSSFAREIERRNEAKEVHENTLIRFKECEITDAELNGNILTISVKFISEQINLIKDHLGNIITGDPSKIQTIQDAWIFAKHLKGNTSIWELVETKII
ncbi:Tim44 domain-containing protein [Holosporaceae bacterium 'Namur']|nr:Tim44 domain-containing protein [Holosporaceae bacterium 'Namur']